MTSAMTYGAKKIRRKTARPGNRRLSMRAIARANGICRTSDSTTMIALCMAAIWKAGSARAFA